MDLSKFNVLWKLDRFPLFLLTFSLVLTQILFPISDFLLKSGAKYAFLSCFWISFPDI